MLKLKWILLAVIVGILITLGLKKLMTTEVSSEKTEIQHSVHATIIKKKYIAPLIRGFGVIKPKVQWKGLSQIKGAIVYKYEK